MTVWKMGELDVVFISYDEECADDNFKHLTSISPRPPLRVHGVKGFHNAYQRASEIVRTPRFISIDADNIILDPRLFSAEINDGGFEDIVFSFNAENSVNGLTYGNGGVK